VEHGFESQDLENFWSAFQTDEGFSQTGFLQLLEDTGESTVLKILARFSESLREGGRGINAALLNDDCETIWKLCHKLAGSAELIGLKAYAVLGREISHQVKANPHLDGHRAELTIFLEWTDKVRTRMNHRCPELKNYL
jgi:HPt (histidine-containing phosphotransfer) domain-containing protein